MNRGIVPAVFVGVHQPDDFPVCLAGCRRDRYRLLVLPCLLHLLKRQTALDLHQVHWQSSHSLGLLLVVSDVLGKGLQVRIGLVVPEAHRAVGDDASWVAVPAEVEQSLLCRVEKRSFILAIQRSCIGSVVDDVLEGHSLRLRVSPLLGLHVSFEL